MPSYSSPNDVAYSALLGNFLCSHILNKKLAFTRRVSLEKG
ncbi:Uncharacterized protein NEOC65_001982 [Neochlamydia sp. AcF65]|nr:Uncharacterized protein [Neochlamydia sp. AcF65]MBS4170586.1 Uncharacterized protein [Neochlamydia sp. AcF95]